MLFDTFIAFAAILLLAGQGVTKVRGGIHRVRDVKDYNETKAWSPQEEQIRYPAFFSHEAYQSLA